MMRAILFLLMCWMEAVELGTAVQVGQIQQLYSAVV
jgi:hypothetical protein